MKITFKEVINQIMATDGIRATLSSRDPRRLRVINHDLTDAIKEMIPQSVEWITYACPCIAKEAMDDESVTLSFANALLETRNRMVTAFIAWHTMHLITAQIEPQTSKYCEEVAENYAMALNRIGTPGHKIPPRIPFWY